MANAGGSAAVTDGKEAVEAGSSAGALFAGPGEVRALARTLDWGATPLGWPDGWSPALRIATRAMLDAPHPICLWSGPEYALVYNDAYRRILAAKHPAALGQPGSVVWAEIWAALEAQFAQVWQGGPPVYGEDARFVMARLEGGATEDAWFSYSLSPLRDEAGRIVAVLNISPETTARVRAEQALEAERKRLAEVVRLAPAFMAVLRGPDHVIELSNAGFDALAARRSMRGRPVAEALPEAAGQGIVALLDRVLATGEPFVGRAVPFRRPDSAGVEDERHVEFVLQALTEQDGTRSGVFVHGVDVTEQVRSRREVERLLAESERARADAEAAHAGADLVRRRLETLLEHLPVGVTLAEAPSGRLLLSNAAVREIWGLDTPAAKIAEYSALYVGFRPGPGPEADRQYGSDEWPLARALASGRPVADEVIEILRPDGTRVMASVNAAPVRDDAGTVIGGIVMTQDVTERERLLAELNGVNAELRRMADAARAAERRARFLADLGQALQPVVAPDALMETTARLLGEHLGADRCAYAEVEGDEDTFTITGNYTHGDTRSIVGRFTFRAFGAEVLRLMRANAAFVVEDADADPRLTPADRAAYEATQIRAVICVPLHKAGRFVAAMAVHQRAPRRWTPHEVELVITVVQRCWEALERARALRRLRESEAALRAASAQLAERTAAAEAAQRAAEEANRAKTAFLSAMSHELRTPLNAIGGYAELLALGVRGPVTDAQRADLERLLRANQHMGGLVTTVLDFARIEAGQVEYHVETVRLGPVVRDLEALVGPQLAAKGLAYDHDGCGPETPDQPHVVRADPEKLRQILLNLLTNAVKFTDGGGRVTLLCEDDAATGVVRVRVTDTGRGIAADQLERIFEPFVQVDRHRTQASQQGVGLGLAISRDLARGMGGDLLVESTPGTGSTFTLTLPRA